MTNENTHPRLNPVQLAIQLAHNPSDKPEEVVARAEAYLKFLSDEQPK